MLFPYVEKSHVDPMNPDGCWDWWGYTGSDYVLRTGTQMAFVRNLIKAVAGY